MKNLRLVLLLTITTILSFSFSSCDKENDIDEIHDEKIVKDLDGNIYNTVTIGTQTWMVENLKTTKYSNGEPIENVIDVTEWKELNTGAYCNYDNNEKNAEVYGRLYNWYAVDDSRKLAPEGWRIPSKNDWEILVGFLIDNGYNFDGTNFDNKIAKSLASNSKWELTTIEGSIGAEQEQNNTSGFSAYPGGFRNDASYNGIGLNCSFWSSSNEDNGAYFLWIFYRTSYSTMSIGTRNSGFAVRCIKE